MRFKLGLLATIGGLMVIRTSGFDTSNFASVLERDDIQISTKLIGDLKTLEERDLTYTGKVIKALLQARNTAPPEDNATSWYPTPLPAKGSEACQAHTCCIWRHIYFDMVKAMSDGSGGCNDLARAAIRLGFHDAGTWNQRTGPYGGADGSIILAAECETRADNKGLAPVCHQMRKWFYEYRRYGVSVADLIQTGHNVATKLCLNGPLVRTFVGRKDRCHPSPEGNLPTQDQSADEILELFGNMTITPHGLVSLLGAHTCGKQFFVNESRSGAAFDKSPASWGTEFYDEVLQDKPSEGVFRLETDEMISRHPRAAAAWQSFTGILGVTIWFTDYSRDYVRLSLLGVNNINDLVECTRVIRDDHRL